MDSIRRLFRPDTPIETFGLVPRLRCRAVDVLPALLLIAALAVVLAALLRPVVHP